jgi:hypothetical protein
VPTRLPGVPNVYCKRFEDLSCVALSYKIRLKTLKCKSHIYFYLLTLTVCQPPMERTKFGSCPPSPFFFSFSLLTSSSLEVGFQGVCSLLPSISLPPSASRLLAVPAPPAAAACLILLPPRSAQCNQVDLV